MNSEEWEQLEALVGGLTEADRYWLEAKGYVEDYDLGLVNVGDLAELVRDSRAGRRSGTSETRLKSEPHVAERAWVVSLLVAAEASEDLSVVDFRKRTLRGRLIQPNRMGEWVSRNAGSPADADREHLVWAAPHDAATTRTRVAPNSPADRLRVLADSLATFYGWQPAQGPAFVLCDAVPVCSPLRVRHIERGPIRAASRIVLEIDPTVPPADVERAYRNARKAFGRERFRPASERDLHAVAFATERPELGPGALLKAWNAAYPEWAFDKAEKLTRVVKSVRRKLLDPFG